MRAPGRGSRVGRGVAPVVPPDDGDLDPRRSRHRAETVPRRGGAFGAVAPRPGWSCSRIERGGHHRDAPRHAPLRPGAMRPRGMPVRGPSCPPSRPCCAPPVPVLACRHGRDRQSPAREEAASPARGRATSHREPGSARPHQSRAHERSSRAGSGAEAAGRAEARVAVPRSPIHPQDHLRPSPPRGVALHAPCGMPRVACPVWQPVPVVPSRPGMIEAPVSGAGTGPPPRTRNPVAAPRGAGAGSTRRVG